MTDPYRDTDKIDELLRRTEDLTKRVNLLEASNAEWPILLARAIGFLRGFGAAESSDSARLAIAKEIEELENAVDHILGNE